MGVVLSGGKIGVPEQFLHRTKVGAAIEKMSRKRVPQRVRVGW